jgi:hypothetical protein
MLKLSVHLKYNNGYALDDLIRSRKTSLHSLQSNFLAFQLSI